MEQKPAAHTFNLGNGNSFSVKQVINAAQEVGGKEIAYEKAERREGDPDVLMAYSSKACEELGWEPKYTDMGEKVSSAWE